MYSRLYGARKSTCQSNIGVCCEFVWQGGSNKLFSNASISLALVSLPRLLRARFRFRKHLYSNFLSPLPPWHTYIFLYAIICAAQQLPGAYICGKMFTAVNSDFIPLRHSIISLLLKCCSVWVRSSCLQKAEKWFATLFGCRLHGHFWLWSCHLLRGTSLNSRLKSRLCGKSSQSLWMYNKGDTYTGFE